MERAVAEKATLPAPHAARAFAPPVPASGNGRSRVPAGEAAGDARVRRDGKFFRLGGQKWYCRGYTYGPFPPQEGDPDAHPLPAAGDVRRDFAQIAAHGANCVRVYHVPPAWLLDEAQAAGLKVLVDVPWPKNQTFHDDAQVFAAAVDAARAAARRLAGHPAVFALSIANEIPADIVRYAGAGRTEALLDEMAAAVREACPHCLVTFANYPSTEYLQPAGVDFVTFNVYLHEEQTFRRYLARLQMIAGEKPLVVGEYGIDTHRETSPEGQAKTLRRQLAAAFDEGVAGLFVFSYTDEWFTHGALIEDWAFGATLAGRNGDGRRVPKPALAAVGEVFARAPQTADEGLPRASVIICSYNGAGTVESCLASMKRIDYPDYEVIFVDDGSTDHTQDILKKFEADPEFAPRLRNIKQPNRGLSVARNVGMEAATGEIIVYTDSDCEADEDWLHQLALQLVRGGNVGLGGPNLIPDENSWVADCVGLSPGGPTHVMIDDRTAEHVPGCNMAFYRWAALEVGGFDSQFRKAGDDVDFIWRLQNRGYTIGFAAAAQVWHYRRNTVQAYLRQQKGYGEAEALLKYKHPDRFNTLGSAHWRGRIYGGDRLGVRVGRDVIYHGTWGTGLFQTIYRRPASLTAQMLMSVEWHLLTLFVLLLGMAFFPLLWVAAAMAAVPIALAVVAAWQAPEPRHKSFWSRPLVAYLHWRQPITRGLARYTVRLRQKELSKEARGFRRNQKFPFLPGDRTVLVYWATAHDPHDRQALLTAITDAARKAGLRFRVDSGWAPYDLEIYASRYVKVQIASVTEYHATGLLTKLRVKIRPSGFARVLGFGLAILTALLLLLLWPFSRPAVLVPLAVACMYLVSKWRVRGPVLGLIDSAALTGGFYPVWPAGEAPAAAPAAGQATPPPPPSAAAAEGVVPADDATPVSAMVSEHADG